MNHPITITGGIHKGKPAWARGPISGQHPQATKMHIRIKGIKLMVAISIKHLAEKQPELI